MERQSDNVQIENVPGRLVGKNATEDGQRGGTPAAGPLNMVKWGGIGGGVTAANSAPLGPEN